MCFSGAERQCDGGGAGDGGGHRWSRASHPGQRVSLDEGPCSAQLEQPDLDPFPKQSEAEFRIPPPAALSR